jgi:copper chaperone CopZ
MRKTVWIVAGILVLAGAAGMAAQQKQAGPAAATLQVTQCALQVSGMSCGGCAEAVKARLLKLEGVKAATVDHTTGEARVEYDAKKTSPEKIVSAFNEDSGGFKAELAKPKPKGN